MTTVLAAATLGWTAAAVAQNAAPPAQDQTQGQTQDQGPDPAAQNLAPADATAAPAATKSNVVSDAQVEANVLSALAKEPTLADQPINTTTTYGTVTLSGTVKDEASKKLAAQVASTSPGVKKVVDSLEIGDISTATAAPDGAAPLPNNAPAADPNAQNQAAPVEQGDTSMQPAGQASQQPYPAPNTAPYPAQRRSPSCPPLYTPDGRPYPQPAGCEPVSGYAAQPQYPAQPGGQQVTVATGAHIQIRVNQGMDAKHTKVGDSFTGILMNDVIAGGSIALPRGSEVTGTVVDAKAGGGLTGSSALGLKLTGINFGGQQYPLESTVWGEKGPSKTGQTVNNTVGMGLLGAVIGGVAGGGAGAAIGAVAGGSAGVATSAATSGPQAFVPPESVLNFTLAKPVTVTTVSQQELDRLALNAPGPRYPPPPPGYRRRYYRPYYYPY